MVFWKIKHANGVIWAVCPDCKYMCLAEEKPQICPECGVTLVTTPGESSAYEICDLRGTCGLSCHNCTFTGTKNCPGKWEHPLPRKLYNYLTRRVKGYDRKEKQ